MYFYCLSSLSLAVHPSSRLRLSTHAAPCSAILHILLCSALFTVSFFSPAKEDLGIKEQIATLRILSKIWIKDNILWFQGKWVMVLGYSGTSSKLFWLGFFFTTTPHAEAHNRTDQKRNSKWDTRKCETRPDANRCECFWAVRSHPPSPRSTPRASLSAPLVQGRAREREREHENTTSGTCSMFERVRIESEIRISKQKKTAWCGLRAKRGADVGRANGSGPLWRVRVGC